ncbi:hypothetical protein LTR78_000228 [Recurvomyces mirabilis]|uniref:histone acetyltransferase n=1 Tax=Recurvomyces mirabilis TaxID=574656 RepID=A0AAE0WXB9_9PEZI|nr:hypothetical protein LTR78_000228 [Recurvomyces mirabilis]KAK5161884.1 hypothetical protein LTS14_000229 [Recurvomyces mirabilis]
MAVDGAVESLVLKYGDELRTFRVISLDQISMASQDNEDESLAQALAAAIPGGSDDNILDGLPLASGFKGKLRYIHSAPRPCDPLFPPPPGREPEKTRLSSHFLSLGVEPTRTAGNSVLISPYLKEQEEGVLGLGVEVFIYHTKYLTTIFVSKADTNGYITARNTTKPACTAFLRWLVNRERRKHPHRKIVVSLFARAQSQYLFPGSAEQSSKHVLDDRQLIKWWAKVLDPLLDLPCTGEIKPEINGYVTIPGYDAQELRSYLPRTQHADGRSWRAGHPLGELAETRGVSTAAPPRSLLPRFPDDPKARFIQELDDEVGLAEIDITSSPSKHKSGRWNSVRNLDRFWEAMEFRQECSSGRVVGFLWVVISPSQVVGKDDLESGASQEQLSQNTISSEAAIEGTPTPTPKRRGKRKPLTGPVVARQPRLKGGSSSLTATSTDLDGMLNSVRGDGLLVSREGYDKALQTLMHLDFANVEAAARSTSKWLAEVRSICGLSGDWAVDLVGTAAHPPARGGGYLYPNEQEAQVNDLGGIVKKKRRAGDVGAEADGPAVNMLSGGALRKKPKPSAT